MRPVARTATRLLLPALGLVLLAGCAGGGGGTDAQPVNGVTRVAAKQNTFTPRAVQVPAGTTVTWTFEDGQVPHDVKGAGLDSGKPKAKGTYTHAFDQPGTYDYRCTLHPGMTGKVVVTAA